MFYNLIKKIMEKLGRIEKFLVTLEQNGTLGEMQQSVILSGEMNSLGGLDVGPTNRTACTNYIYSACHGTNEKCVNYDTACGGAINEECITKKAETLFNQTIEACKNQ